MRGENERAAQSALLVEGVFMNFPIEGAPEERGLRTVLMEQMNKMNLGLRTILAKRHPDVLRSLLQVHNESTDGSPHLSPDAVVFVQEALPRPDRRQS